MPNTICGHKVLLTLDAAVREAIPQRLACGDRRFTEKLYDSIRYPDLSLQDSPAAFAQRLSRILASTVRAEHLKQTLAKDDYQLLHSSIIAENEDISLFLMSSPFSSCASKASDLAVATVVAVLNASRVAGKYPESRDGALMRQDLLDRLVLAFSNIGLMTGSASGIPIETRRKLEDFALFNPAYRAEISALLTSTEDKESVLEKRLKRALDYKLHHHNPHFGIDSEADRSERQTKLQRASGDALALALSPLNSGARDTAFSSLVDIALSNQSIALDFRPTPDSLSSERFVDFFNSAFSAIIRSGATTVAFDEAVLSRSALTHWIQALQRPESADDLSSLTIQYLNSSRSRSWNSFSEFLDLPRHDVPLEVTDWLTFIDGMRSAGRHYGVAFKQINEADAATSSERLLFIQRSSISPGPGVPVIRIISVNAAPTAELDALLCSAAAAIIDRGEYGEKFSVGFSKDVADRVFTLTSLGSTPGLPDPVRRSASRLDAVLWIYVDSSQ